MSDALKLWREKLADLLVQEVTATGDDKFRITKAIEEAKAKIAELEQEAGNPSGQATQPERRFDISRIVKYAPPELIGRDQETALLDKALTQMKRGTKTRPRVLTFVALGGEGKTSLVSKWADGLDQKDWPGCEAAFAWSFYSQGSRDQTAVSSDLFLAKALEFFGDAEMAVSAQGAFEKGQRLAQLVGERKSILILDGLEPLQFPPTSATPGKLKDQGIEALLRGLARHSHGLCVVTTRFEVADIQSWPETAPQHALLRLSTQAGVDLLRSIDSRLSLRESSATHDKDSLHSDATFAERKATIQGTQTEFESLVEDVDGHALTLQILCQYLVRAHRGDIRRRDRIDFAKAGQRIPGGPGLHADHAFRAIAAYEAWLADDSDESRRELAVLRLLGLFDRPATADCVQALLQPPAIDGLTNPLVALSDDDWEFTLTTLSGARLVSVNRVEGTGELLSLDAHPLIREYFAVSVRSSGFSRSTSHEPPKGGTTNPDAYRLAHRRLYEHLCETTKEGDQPTLEDLQPLYQAVAHGCQAGLHQEAYDSVYFARIRKGNQYYSVKMLGAFGSDLGAVACFFESPWQQLSPLIKDSTQSRLLSASATWLRALGRVAEAVEPMRASLETLVAQNDWKQAAAQASNLSELALTLGDVSGAVSDAERSVTFADRSGDEFHRMTKRITHADALHQSGGGLGFQPKSAAGSHSHAESLFHEAEQMQAERQPAYPLLYSLQGFKYCDLLLGSAERQAWRKGLGLRVEGRGQEDGTDLSLNPQPSSLNHSETCRDVTDRATQTLNWGDIAFHESLLDIALDQLTLARAALYEAILSADSSSSFILPPSSLFDSAVSGLRRAGTTHHIPRGLLTRAWYRSLGNERTGHDSAQSDLDEAWEIASRGPMPLFLADIHLHRARLFAGGDREWGRGRDRRQALSTPLPISPTPSYPWESPEHDLAEARRLIEKHGYGRRLEELDDAERALLQK